MTPPNPVRVMIVEDSAVVRQLLVHIVGSDPRFHIVSAVGSAEEALASLAGAAPDVISMDIRLPGMDGLEATRRIMSERPTPIVVFADAVEDQSLKISLNALRAGALTVVEKPVGLGAASHADIAHTICTQLYIMSSVPVIRRREVAAAAAAATQPPRLRPSPGLARLDYVAIAASTGGPPALARVLEALPGDFPAPVLLVQHMGNAFMEGFAAWLDGLVPMRSALAQDREPALPGRIYVAPGDRHLTLDAEERLRLTLAPPVRGHRPSATPLFSSLAASAGPRSLGVILTGMGEDGASGLLELRSAGGHTIAEAASSAVVYGMPAAAVALGAASEIMALEDIGARILALAARRRAP